MFEIAVITGALGGLKTASDLIKTMRDGVKSKQMKLDEVDSRISEVYDHVVEAKAALNDAKDEISRLQAELSKLKDFEENYELRDNMYWRKGTNDAYCPLCLKDKQKAVPLQNKGEDLGWHCGIHNKTFRRTPTPGQFMPLRRRLDYMG